MKQITLALLLLPLAAAFVLAQDPSWHQVPKEDLLDNRGEIAKIIQSTQDENILLDIWQRPETDETILYLKMLASKRLGLYGTPAAVPILVARLDNDKDGFYARYALETIPGNEVDIALGEALKTVKRPAAIAGILTTLGVRGNPVSAETVAPFLTHENADVRNAAGYAFAMTARNDTLMTPFKNEKTVSFPVDSAFLLAEQLENRGIRMPLYDIIVNGTLLASSSGTPGNEGKLVLSDMKEYQKMAAIYQGTLTGGLDRVSTRTTRQIAPIVMTMQLAPDTPRRLFEVGLKASRELPADEKATVARAMIGQLDAQTDLLRKAKLVRAIGDRKDKESKAVALPVIAKLAQSRDVAVRVAAIDALRNVGDASVVPILIAAVTQTSEQRVADAARNTLIGMPAEGIDEAMSAALEKGETPAIKVALMDIIAERRIFSASPILLKLLQDSDASVSEAAISALGQISGVEDLPVLLELLKQAKSAAETKKLLNVLKSACTRFSQDAAATEVAKALDGSSTEVKTQLLDLLKEIAGTKALAIVEGYAWGNDAEMRNVATRILGEWRSPPDLDQLAAACLKLAKESQEYKVRGLRGYIRLARQFDMPEDRRLSMCKEFFELADRDDERTLIFDVFSRLASIEALEQAASYLDTPALQERAAETAVVIGKKLQGRQPQAAKIMEDVVNKTKRAETRLQAEAIRTKLAGVDEGVEIVKAVYGVGDKTVDVTAKVRAASGGSTLLEIGSYNAAFGDVAPQVVKTLKITYKIKGGSEKTAEFPENASIVLPK